MIRLLSIPLIIALLIGTTSAQAEIKVLTSIKPLQLIAAAVQDGVGEADVLLPASASAHHYALRPSDVRRLQDATLFYWVGPDLENFLPRALNGRQGPSVAMQELPGLTLRHFGEDHAHDHEHEHEHEHEHDDHDHDHRPGSLDAHLWLLPANARVIAERMAADFAAADPTNAERYQANGRAFSERIEALDQRLRQRLANVQNKPFFVFHQAYDYFEAAYGLSHSGVFTAGSEVQPGARHVAAMRERLQQAGPSCVFSEPPMRPRLAETLTSGLPATMAELDVLGVEQKVDAQGYERLIEELGSTLASCLESL